MNPQLQALRDEEALRRLSPSNRGVFCSGFDYCHDIMMARVEEILIARFEQLIKDGYACLDDKEALERWKEECGE